MLTSAYGPCDLQSAYNLLSASPSLGSGTTIAIVDAFDDPNAESDLATYRQHYALPPCPSSNGCFQKLNQTGGTLVYPAPNPSWSQEISVDLDMASAICPLCHLRLIEANSNLNSDLYAAEDTAVSSGAHIVSNSWGGNEYSGENLDDVHFNRPGVAITVSSGDSGFGVEYPAASQYVTAVGGTTLNPANNSRGWSETAWSGAGSGCSASEPQPSWQAALKLPGCADRMVADVSAEADPNTPVWAYVTFGGAGWTAFGGTSVASPIVAGVYALAGNASSVTYGSFPYSHTGALYDVTGGSNGSCSPGYLCTGVAGYDGPTGLGTPNGTGAF